MADRAHDRVAYWLRQRHRLRHHRPTRLLCSRLQSSHRLGPARPPTATDCCRQHGELKTDVLGPVHPQWCTNRHCIHNGAPTDSASTKVNQQTVHPQWCTNRQCMKCCGQFNGRQTSTHCVRTVRNW